MKFQHLSLIVLLVFPIVTALSGNLRHMKDERDRHLIILDGSVDACIEVKDGSTADGNSFVLSDCSNYDYGIDPDPVGEDYSDSMIRLRLDPSKCMQATHNGVLEMGAWMRVYPCDDSNPLQHFDATGGIRLKDTNWCAAYRGNNPHTEEGSHPYMDADHILLKNCDEVDYGWSHD